MVTLISVILLIFFYSYKLAKNQGIVSPFKVSAIVGGILGCFIGAFIAFGIGALVEKNRLYDNPNALSEFGRRDKSGSGYFVMASTIRVSRYIFYRTLENKFDEVKASNAIVIQEIRHDGIVQKYSEEFPNNYYWLFAFHIRQEGYDILIPKGALVYISTDVD